jgi:hypothetical protein
VRFGFVILVVVSAGLLLGTSACGDDDYGSGSTPAASGGGQSTPELTTAVITEASGRTATLGVETYISDRTLPADRLSAEQLEDAGMATASDGESIPMARAATADVSAWEVVSPDPRGWLVWRSGVIDAVLDDAGQDSSLGEVEVVDWPNACLGAPRPEEACAEVITPGYRVFVARGGDTLVYHASRAGDFRLAS